MQWHLLYGIAPMFEIFHWFQIEFLSLTFQKVRCNRSKTLSQFLMFCSYLPLLSKETSFRRGPEKSGEDRNILACAISGKFTDLMRHICIPEVADAMFQAYLKVLNFVPKYNAGQVLSSLHYIFHNSHPVQHPANIQTNIL